MPADELTPLVVKAAPQDAPAARAAVSEKPSARALPAQAAATAKLSARLRTAERRLITSLPIAIQCRSDATGPLTPPTTREDLGHSRASQQCLQCDVRPALHVDDLRPASRSTHQHNVAAGDPKGLSQTPQDRRGGLAVDGGLDDADDQGPVVGAANLCSSR